MRGSRMCVPVFGDQPSRAARIMDTRAIRSRSVFVAIERTTLSLIFVQKGDKLYKLIRTSRAAPTITGEGSPDPQPALGTPGYFPASETAAFHEQATLSICAAGATHTYALGSEAPNSICNADAASASCRCARKLAHVSPEWSH